jgi:hypothetical protein
MTNVIHANTSHLEASMVVFANAEFKGGQRSQLIKQLGSVAMRPHHDVVAGEGPGYSEDDFRYFETQLSPYESAEIVYRTGLLDGFEPFSVDVQRIKSELKHKPANEIGGFLASGNEADVFTVVRDGKSYALRVSKVGSVDEKYGNAEHIDTYVAPPFRAAHIDGMEKLVGLSYEYGATVAEVVPGKPMAEYSAEEIAAIPEGHWQKLAKVVVSAARAGISLDGNEGNLLYDHQTGFGFVDFGTRAENRGIAQPVTTSVFGTDTWLPRGELPVSEHAEDYDVLRDVLSVTIPTYDRWLQILAETQNEMGVDDGYLTRLNELQETSDNLKNALAELTKEGSEEFTRRARAVRQERISSLERQIDNMDPGFMRDNKVRSLAERRQTPDRIFPKGSIRPSRNDNRRPTGSSQGLVL